MHGNEFSCNRETQGLGRAKTRRRGEKTRLHNGYKLLPLSLLAFLLPASQWASLITSPKVEMVRLSDRPAVAPQEVVHGLAEAQLAELKPVSRFSLSARGHKP
jgi:hypothetical protein